MLTTGSGTGPDVCKETPAVIGGPCLARIPKWTYKPFANSCFKFFWGGCGGNGNNFDTKEECENTCGTKGPGELFFGFNRFQFGLYR